MITVTNIRSQNIIITNEPIVYYWWFNIACFEQLLNFLNQEIDFDQILVKDINEETYGLLYIGKGKNGHDRLVKYHILDSQNFHTTGVNNGRLSSLRQTLCGLLNFPMSTSQVDINNFIDQYCIVEYETCFLEDLNTVETDKITNNYLPLNYQHTTGVLTPQHRRILTYCKNSMRY
jgi:hypothetical protein